MVIEAEDIEDMQKRIKNGEKLDIGKIIQEDFKKDMKEFDKKMDKEMKESKEKWELKSKKNG